MVIALARLQQRRAEQRAALQVEGLPGKAASWRASSAPGSAAPLRSRTCQRQRRGRIDHGHRAAVHRREPGAQRRVARHEPVERGAQRRDVQRTGAVDRPGHVVGRAARVELLEEPEPLLAEGQRGAVRRCIRRRRSAARRRPRARQRRRASIAAASAGDGRRREERAQLQLHAEGGSGCGSAAGLPAASARPGGRSCRARRRRDAEQRTPQGGQLPLGVRARRDGVR